MTDLTVFSETHKTINGESVCDFLNVLRKIPVHHDKKIHLFLDNGSSNSFKLVSNVAEKLNIKLHFIPTYSPNCNPIERFWKILSKIVRNNVYFKSEKDFRQKIDFFLKEKWSKIKDKFKSWITDNFEILESVV